MRYALVRGLLRYALGGFFREVRLTGVEAVPKRGPVLFLANHTNAFIDPLVLMSGIRRPVTITVKSTLAAHPLLAPLIRGQGVILFHRRADAKAGSADPAKNADAIRACADKLASGGALLIFPEGVSHSDPAMRGFKTGAARIVLEFLQRPSVQDLTIVPLGLHFTKKDRWRSEATGLVGTGVSARAWAEAHPEADAREWTTAMRGWIEQLTVNFETEEERRLILEADRLFGRGDQAPEPLDRRVEPDTQGRVERVRRLQRGVHLLRAKDPDAFRRAAAEAHRLGTTLERLGVEPEEIGLPMHAGRAAMFVVRELEVLTVGAVPALLGWLVNLPPLVLLRWLVARLSDDEDHPASNAVFLSIPVIGLWWLLVVVTASIALPLGWLPVVIAALPFTAAVRLRYRDRAAAARHRVRTFLLWLRKPELRDELDRALRAWQDDLRAIEARISPSGATGSGDPVPS